MEMGFFSKLFGGSADKAKSAATSVATGGGAGSSAVPDTSREKKPKQSYAEKEYEKMQRFVARFEADGIDLAGLDRDDFVGINVKMQLVSMAQGEGKTEEEAVLEQGFQSKKHYWQVVEYMMFRCTELRKDETGEDETYTTDVWNNAAAEAGMKAVQMMQSSAASADPTLLEPVGGVTVEQWAGAAAGMATLGEGATPDQVAQLLAKWNLDRASYDAAQEGWMAKMQGDTTGAISQKYAEAFAAGQGLDTSQEPCTFEYFIEIQVAQEAWAKSGKDVNAELKNVFGITAIDYSNHSQYWSMKYATDMELVRRGDELRDKFLAKYSTAGMDDDLSL